jgi:hypothetical protein
MTLQTPSRLGKSTIDIAVGEKSIRSLGLKGGRRARMDQGKSR